MIGVSFRITADANALRCRQAQKTSKMRDYGTRVRVCRVDVLVCKDCPHPTSKDKMYTYNIHFTADVCNVDIVAQERGFAL